ncbi:hypothetical protein QO001_000844 [Methylobacterium brachiatum]|jgi:hypothetical protein|uniref:Haemolysin XhlA n=1 Tax=Methylobacterium brachiatum TaxID=269660 RepID=A0AAJ1TJQ5_9HYPH|nr:hemolysin XhlA family protein [Methylobacterium brachiatum]MCB4803499.1 hemolysin XhlA family protein [Methylobacterium brachiatum]MDQ0541936.1 hypothetical protein [Methylobacterium brachiatum]
MAAALEAVTQPPAFLRFQDHEAMMPEGQKSQDEAAWTKMQVDVAVSATKLDAVQSDVRGIREDLRNVYATKTELKDVVDDVSKLKDHVGWLVKSVLGAIVLAIVGLVLSKGGVPH